MTILLTAFDPFGGESVNASQEALEALPDSLAGITLHKLLLPTVFRLSGEQAIAAAERIKPDAILSLGQAGGRKALTPERIAVNLMDARIPDNAGFQPTDEPVVPGGPAAYFSTLPVKRMAAAINAAGLPAQVSNTAGTFVCNSLMYTLLRWAATHAPEVRCGFLHLPLAAGLDRYAALRGLEAALEVLIQNRNEVFYHAAP